MASIAGREKRGMIITVKVVPSAGKQQLIVDKSGQLKCYVKSAAEKNLANNELIAVLAAALRCSKHDIEIMTGLTSRLKRVRVPVSGSFNDLLEKLGLALPEHQHSLL